MDIALIVTVVSCTAGATWLVRSAIGDVATALRVHVIEESGEREALEKRIVSIEEWKNKRQRK
jgi:hypothetical protein